MGGFAELDMDTAHGVMIGEFFAGLDVAPSCPPSVISSRAGART